MNTFSAKACWMAAGTAVVLIVAARLPSADAASSAPVVLSTATPAPCATPSCQHVQPDVIALTNVAPAPPSFNVVIYVAKSTLFIKRVVSFPHEVDIALQARDGTRETIHVPVAARPPSASLRFPSGATLDSVIQLGQTARVLYHSGGRGGFNEYVVSAKPQVTRP